MSGILGQLSIAVGGLLFVVVMIITVASGVPLLTAIFRASIVMCVSSVTVALFLRFFTSLVYRFVAEQVMKHRRAKAAADAERVTDRLGEAAGTGPANAQ